MRNIDPLRASMVVFALGVLGFASLLYVPSAQQEALFYQSDFVSVPDGTLIRAEGDSRVYIAVDGRKRWIDSIETFQAQGFRVEDIRTITNDELNRYEDGVPVTIVTRLVLSREKEVLPDLAPLAPYDVRLSTVAGRTVIRFTGSFWNKGYHAFKLVSENQKAAAAGADGTEDVYQVVQAEDGTTRKTYAGTFVWHAAHNHHHYAEFAEYLFSPAVQLPTTASSAPASRQKTTFCIRDDERMPADIPDVPLRPVYTTCGADGQAVSPGWIDVYPSTLPDQYVDVHDLPPGVYALSFLLDPMRRFIEEDGGNNISTTLVALNVQSRQLRVIGQLSPFPTLRNRVDDGTLLRDASDGNVYVVNNNHRRWIHSEDILTSYGYNQHDVYAVTHAMITAIPPQKLIRQQGSTEVFVVNEFGYRRHILNSQVFASYGFLTTDIVDINSADIESYPLGDLIVLPGGTEVYRIEGSTKHAIGALSVLQREARDLSGLHVVNQADFDSYSEN